MTDELPRTPLLRVETDYPVEDLIDWPGNARVHDEDLLDESADSYGQFRTVLAREMPDGRLQLLAGHGTRDALLRRGITRLEVEVRDVPDDDVARGIVLIDNRANDRAGYDDAKLLALLEEAASGDLHLQGTGWDDDDLDDLRAVLEESDSAPAGANPGHSENTIRDKGLTDLQAGYEGASSRSVVLNYAGAQYIWVVETLGALAHRYDVDSNADVVLRMLEEATGTKAPAPGEMEATPDGPAGADAPEDDDPGAGD